VFVAEGNIVCTLKWSNLKAKIRKIEKSKFGGINSNSLSLFSIEYSFSILHRSRFTWDSILPDFVLKAFGEKYANVQSFEQ
jgi:hypothetical protein